MTYESPRVRGLRREKEALEAQAKTMESDLQDLREQITRKHKLILDELAYQSGKDAE